VNDTPRCHAVRRLNPFLGVLEVVAIDGARALSADGLDWQIQVEAERPEHTWGRGQAAAAVRQFFRFGSWHPQQGLSRVPANPILDIGAMLAASERMVAALQTVQDDLPFPFADHFEHWLLDAAGQPLALLAATVAERHIGEIRAGQWQATTPTNPPFTAPSLVALGIPADDGHGNHHADILERRVRDAAGPAPRHGWYQRLPDGSGRPLQEHLAPLDAAAFPALPLRPDWDDANDRALVRDYLHWLAPWLLALDSLDDTLRHELEQAARNQALALADHYRLYPRVLQPEVLDSARVEARLRRTSG